MQRPSKRASARPARDAGNAPRPQEARAVQMTVKSADMDDMDTAEIASALKAAQEESWRRLEYADEDVIDTSLMITRRCPG